MHLAVIREAAEAASAAKGLFHGYPPWLLVIAGAAVVALVLWIFAKLLKWVMWLLIFVVLVGGIVIAANMYLGR